MARNEARRRTDDGSSRGEEVEQGSSAPYGNPFPDGELGGLRHVLELLRQAVPLLSAVVLVPADGRLVVQEAVGLEAPPAHVDIAARGGFEGAGLPLLDWHAAAVAGAASSVRRLLADGATRMWSGPLQLGAEPFGVLLVGSATPLHAGHHAILTLTCHHVASVLERDHLQARIEAVTQRFDAVVDSAVDAIVTIDERGVTESYNRAAERLFGWRAGEVVGRNVSMLMPSPYREEHDGHMARYHATGEARIIGIGREVVGRRRDGSMFPLWLSVSEAEVAGRRVYTGIMRDLTSAKKAEEALADAALRDPLTGTANRRLLHDRVDRGLGRLHRHPGQGLAMLFLDLDGFKPVNDSYGHAVGDQLLIAVTERLLDVVRDADTVARLGGDEFAILLEDLHDAPEAETVAARVVEVVARPITVPDAGTVSVTASVGIVWAAQGHGLTSDTLLQEADAAMYRAKQAGGDRALLAARS